MKVQFISTDNAPDIVKAIRELDSPGFLPGVYHLRCLGHTINLIVKVVIEFEPETELNTGSQSSQRAKSHKDQYIMFDYDEVKSIKRFLEITKKCRNICSKFSHSTKMNCLLDEIQVSNNEPVLNIIQEIKTRWNSTFKMLERLLIVKTSVNRVLNETSNSQNKNKSFLLNEQDINDMGKFVEILSYFNDASHKLSGETYTTASVVIPILQAIRNKLTDSETISDCSIKKYFASALLKSLDFYIESYNYFDNELLNACSYLDPR